jgi:hypothetical protein
MYIYVRIRVSVSFFLQVEHVKFITEMDHEGRGAHGCNGKEMVGSQQLEIM